MDFQKFHISVKALIENQGRFLLLEEKDHVWEAPGGRVDLGETLKMALSRELNEELSIKINESDIGNLIGIDQRYDYKYGDDFALITFFYEIDFGKKIEVKLSSEHIDYVRVDKKTDLSGLSFKNLNQRNIFEEFRKRL